MTDSSTGTSKSSTGQSASGRPLAALLAAVLASAGLAWFARDVDGLRRRYPADGATERPVPAELSRAGWFSIDPDGLYHARRVERALREGSVAGEDPYLNSPHGARIPWPPYYDAVLVRLLGPFAPDAEAGASDFERRAFLERAVSTLPALFGLGTAALAALLAFRLARGTGLAARTTAALFAGATLAFTRASINYSVVGTGDHHAWVSLLNAGLLALATVACCRSNLARPGRSLLLGLAAGALAGLMLGSWVAALLYVVELELALAWLLLRRAREELPGVATFGLAFHLAAAAAVLPAVLASPWKDEFPWTAVNLSWFHPTQLLVGALVFVPPLLLGRAGGPLAAGEPWARRYPWLVGVVLLTGGGLLWAAGAGPARGVAEGFAWVSRVDAFMDSVLESLPLVGPRAGGPLVVFDALGYGALLLPLCYVPLALHAFRGRRHALVPLAVAVPPMVVQALVQRRFADALALPLAVCLGWGAARLVQRLAQARGPRRVPGALWPLAGLALALVLQTPSLGRTLTQLLEIAEHSPAAGHAHDVQLGDRLAYDWMRRQPRAPEGGAVLAHWDRGHALEWAADRPSVATNFGSYVGIESYRDPARFFLSEDPLEGGALLEARGVQFVFVPASLPDLTASMVRILDPALASRYLTLKDGRELTSPRWLSTLGARLLNGGVQLVPPQVPAEERPSPLGYLRLVHVSPYVHPLYRDPVEQQPMPANLVYERVPGAAIAVHGAAGERVAIELELEFPRAGRRYSLAFRADCDATGLARLWVPYATDAPNGDGLVERARFRVGDGTGPGRSGTVEIPEAAVLGGPPIQVP